MPWRPLPQIAFAVAVYPFQPSSPADLPLELGDELYIIEQGGVDGSWYRGYLVAPPSLLAGLTSVKGQTLEARVFSGIFPRNCVEVREVLGEAGAYREDEEDQGQLETWRIANGVLNRSDIQDGHSLETNDSEAYDKVNGTPDGSLKPKRSTKGKRKSAADSVASRSLSKKRSEKDGTQKPTRNRSHRSMVSRRSQRLSVPMSPIAAGPTAHSTPRPPAPVPMLKIGDETPTSAEEPLVDEVASCLREWHSTKLHELLLARQYHLIEKMSKLVRKLDFARKQLLHTVLTDHELVALRQKTVWNLVNGNKILCGEVIVRDPDERGRVLTSDDSAVEMTKLQSMMSLLSEPPVQHVDAATLQHLLVDVRGFASSSKDAPLTLFMSLYSKKPGMASIPLSEAYTVDLPAQGSLSALGQIRKMETLFSDLSAIDIGDGTAADGQLYLVVKVQTTVIVTAKRSTSRGSPAPLNGNPPSKSIGANTGGTGSVRIGRRSLMWSQMGSYRSRSGQASKLGLRPSTADSTASSNIEGRPDTPKAPPSPNQQEQKYVQRNVAIGVLNIGHVLRQTNDVESTVTFWALDNASENEQASDLREGWDEIIRDLVPAHTGGFLRSRRAEQLHILMKPFISHNVKDLIKRTPTLLHDVGVTPRIGFSGAPTAPRSDIYVTLLDAYLPRQAMLSHAKSGTTSLPHNVALTNLQLTLEVRKASGERIENCVFPSSNSVGSSAWRTVVAQRDDGWNQTIKLAIDHEDVPGAHIVMSLADAPDFPFALSWMPLWDQQAFVRDGNHSLLLYKYDEYTSSVDGGKGAYMSLSWNARGRDAATNGEAIAGPMASLRLKTYLCSTQFSQEQALLGLLKWRESPPSHHKELMKGFAFLPEIEIVKHLDGTFDALFSILVEHAGDDEFEDLVFNCIVTVLGIVHDRRFNLGPLVDQYTNDRFNYPFATPCLLRSFTRLMSNPADPRKSRELRATFKVARQLLKFTINAREQQQVKEAGIGITSTQSSFSRDIHTIFKSLEALMTNPAPILVGSKTLVVQHFHSWLPELSGLFTPEEILHIAINFMDSCAEVTGKLILYRLVLILNYTRVELFAYAELRQAVIMNTVRWLDPYWGKPPEHPEWGKTAPVTDQWREQVRLCCSIVSLQIDDLGQGISRYLPKIIESYRAIQVTPTKEKRIFSLLFPTTYPFPSKAITTGVVFDEALVELFALLAATSDLPSNVELGISSDDLPNFLFDSLQVHLSILACEAFPCSWLSAHIYHHKSTMKTLEFLSGIFMDSFLPHPDDADEFNTELWRAFFVTLLKLVGSEALALETFPEQKRRAVWKIAGDVREQGADLLRRTWEAIGWETSVEDRRLYGLQRMGGYQVQYVPGLVGPIVELCLSVHEGLRAVAVEVLQTMIVGEWTLSENLDVIQAEMIDCLDQLFKSKHLTESIVQKLFVNELLHLFEPLSSVEGHPLHLALKDMIATIDEFLDLLVAVHSTEMAGEAFQITHTLRLMDFLRDMQKESIFIRYVHQLASIQVKSRNFVAAGLALRLHADLYPWDPANNVLAMQNPPLFEQTAFERKEHLYFEMIKHFEDGRAWDNALATYRELTDQYENNVYDFAKLARTQRAMAKIYETIAKGESPTPRYFRVVYRGLGFPTGLRDKHFIHEGSPFERLSAFIDRMQQQHPSAQVAPPGDITDVEGQFLQISAVSPHRDLFHPVYQRSKILQSTREYLLDSRPCQFSITSRRQAPTIDVNEQWVEKTIYTTAESFPTILRKSEIIAVDEVRLSALQTAVERIVRKTQELSVLESRFAQGEDSIFSVLTDALTESVHPSSDASVALYRQLLPAQEEESEVQDNANEEKELEPLYNALKTALLDHAVELKRCLSLYSRPAHQATRAELARYLEAAFAPEIASLIPFPQAASAPGSPWTTATPVLNLEPSSPPLKSSSSVINDKPEPKTRQTRQDKNRLSLRFLTRASSENSNTNKDLATNNGSDTGSGFKFNGTGALPPQDDETSSQATSSRSRSKSAHRRSFFKDHDKEEAMPTSPSNSTTSPKLESRTSDTSLGESMMKRLSSLKGPRKHSKPSVKVQSVLEE
ncbi:MAG: hypothetical protein M1835_007390 [Candelina submexicana]|nr:MAG: hypothetical protein M1835_007390 [Candelina submexicana]